MNRSERRVIASFTMTIDGHTTGPDGPYDMSCIAPYGVSDQARDALVDMTSATTVLLGRSNYEGFGHYWPGVAGDNGAEPRDRAFAQWLDSVDKVIFSRSLTSVTWSGARLATADPATTVRELRSQGRGDIRVLASQSLIRQLLAADELDQLDVTISPMISGGGARLFDDTQPASTWRVSHSDARDDGAVGVTYERVRGAAE